MIEVMDFDWEEAKARGDYMFLVPWEICRSAESGEVSVRVYPEFYETAEQFYDLYSEDPFSENAYVFVRRALSAPMRDAHVRLDRSSRFVVKTYEKKTLTEVIPHAPWLNTDARIIPEKTALTFPVPSYDGSIESLASYSEDNGKIVAAAQVNDFCDEGENHYELNVETAVGYRNRGLASANVSRLSNEILRRGGIPVYCVRSSNKASVSVAMKCGFELKKDTLSFVYYAN